MRLLDADKVLVFQLYNDETEDFYEKEFTIEDYIDTFAIDGCPKTVDAEPIRHGHWARKFDAGVEWYECSECGRKASVFWGANSLTDYCPHCGAKMDAKGEDDAD